MKILLMGNPNVGKSVVFNRLTGVDVISSNYPGTTIGFTKGCINIEGNRHEVVDVPGTYTLEPTCKAEEIAVQMINEGDVIINVIDSTNLERNLNLTLQLIKQKKPLIVCLNLWDETKHTGIVIDREKLEKILDLPCVPCCAVTGQGIKELVDKIAEARLSRFNFNPSDRWNVIGGITDKVQRITHKHHTFMEKISDISIRPLTGIPIAIGVLFLTFSLIRFIGESLIGYVFEPLFENIWSPLILKLSALLGGGGFFHDLLVGKLIEGQIDYGQSFGLLTTGLFVPLGAVLPYVLGFYIVLSILEDSGYLPRVAVMVDVIMHKLGLHGLSIIPMLLAFGCNVPGALATRILETRKERFISATLMSIAVPCMALQAMIIGLIGKHGFIGLGIVFGTLFVVWLVLGIILKYTVKGTAPEIFIEIPHYRLPYFPGLLKKLWMRMKWFLKEALPFVFLGVVLVNLMYSLGIIQLIGKGAAPVVSTLLGLPKEAAGALFIGFLRKDLAVGMLAPMHLSLKQLIVASVVLSMYFPCVATFTTLIKELGFRDMMKSAAIMVLSSIIVGSLLNLILFAL
ncbi:MAG: ferrous iron transporter B [Spirochaetales bacterium]|nr:ferrous iron transporter B [Spirochaetales bacterium]